MELSRRTSRGGGGEWVAGHEAFVDTCPKSLANQNLWQQTGHSVLRCVFSYASFSLIKTVVYHLASYPSRWLSLSCHLFPNSPFALIFFRP
ncbi:hypothetical protein YC2023_025182 [Brassica napus]